MANTYTYSGPATRWSEGDPTAVDFLNVSRVNSDHLYEALNTILVTSGVTSGAASTLVSHTQTNTQSPGNNSTRIATTAFVTAAVAASSTSPGGSTTQIQYNNSGAFGGSANLAWTNGTSTLSPHPVRLLDRKTLQKSYLSILTIPPRCGMSKSFWHGRDLLLGIKNSVRHQCAVRFLSTTLLRQ
mgnify:CR=1 FL=1